jgi:serine/threonine protein kinase
MEYFPGGDLDTYLREKPPLPENEAGQIISQVLEGLAIMHREKYAHRDIKPGNILIHQRPVPGGPQVWWVKLADFGLTKILMQTVISASAAIGTPGYIAPELVMNHGAQGSDALDVDHFATDIWSLGATTFHILTGTPPFPGYFDIFQYLKTPEVSFPRAKLDQHLVSRAGHDFVRAMLEPKPEERPDSEAARSHAWILAYTPKVCIHGE